MPLGVGVTLSYVGCHGYHITKCKTLMTLYLCTELLEVNLEHIWYTYDKDFLRYSLLNFQTLLKQMRFSVLPQHELAKFCLKPFSETQYISSSCTLCCMLSKWYAHFTIKCITYVLWPTIRKSIYFLKCFHVVLYTALKNHVPLPRFPETFSMWYRIVFGTKWYRFHNCCNLWWVYQ